MIIILKSGATDAQIDHVIERVESLGLRAHLSRGTHRTIIGVIGDESQFEGDEEAELEAEGLEQCGPGCAGSDTF